MLEGTPLKIEAVRSDVPPDLQVILSKAIAVDPDQRYQDARKLQLDLQHWISAQAGAGTTQDLHAWLEGLMVEVEASGGLGSDTPSQPTTTLETRIGTPEHNSQLEGWITEARASRVEDLTPKLRMP